MFKRNAGHNLSFTQSNFRLLTYRRLAAGFSLVELMIIVAISAILVAIAIPSYQQTMASSRILGAVNLLEASLDTLRNEAVSNNRIAVICRSTAPFATTPTCSSTASANAAADDWGIGWIIYSRPNEPDPVVATSFGYNAATDRLVQRVVPMEASSEGVRTTITWNPATDMMVMGPQGTRINAAGVEPIISVDYRLPTAALNVARAKCISINLLGRSSVQNASGAGC
jgi:Tfp pilus assembly protein FimT